MHPMDPGRQGSGLRLHVAGIPIRVDLSFLVIAVLFGWGAGDWTVIVAWVAVLFVSILVHELGHAFTLRAFGVPSDVTLYAMGGVTVPERRLGERWQRVTVSLAGPLTGLFLLGVPAVLIEQAWLERTDTWDAALSFLIWVNVAWSFVNLLPVLPLDGGNVTKELLDAATNERGEVPARVVSIVVTGLAGLYALSLEWIFGALFAVFFLALNVRALSERKNQRILGDVRQAFTALYRDDFATASSLAAKAVGQASDHRIHALASETLAWSQLASGDEAAARTTIARFPPTQTPSGHLRALLTETDPAERVNATVDAWLDESTPPPPPAYVRLLAPTGLLDPVVDRLVASRADTAAEARTELQKLLFHTGHPEAAARLTPPSPPTLG